MSRWSRPHTAPGRIAIGAAALSLLMVTGLAQAWAEPSPGPVFDLEAPSVDLHTGVSSLDGSVTVEDTRGGAKARIDATVLFGKDSAQLRPAARGLIRQVAKEFIRNGPGKVRVVGYTDDLGPADHGLRLSIHRAGAVANTLADLLPRSGYPMTAIGKGEQDPAVPNTSEANRRKNRRVVITLDRVDTAKPGSETSTQPDKQKPKHEPTAVAASPATRSASPPSSASPSATAKSPAPTAEPTPTTASPTRNTSSTPELTEPPTGASNDDDPVRGWRGHSTLISNLFLALLLTIAGAAALSRRLRRPDDLDNVAKIGANDLALHQPSSGAADRLGNSTQASDVIVEHSAEPPKQDAANKATAGDLSAAMDVQALPGRDDVEFALRPHLGRPQPHTRAGRAPRLGDLDADLRDWFSERCDLPRLSLLGPVSVRAHGTPIARRKPFYTELLAFLALRPHGATPEQVASAFGLTPARVRNDVKVLRDWLGTNPRTGRRHLPDARDTAVGRARGLAVYQVEGILVDLDLFQRLIQRADAAGPEGLMDLDRALSLVLGRPFDQLRPRGWEWLYEGDRIDLQAEAAIQCASERAEDLRGRTQSPEHSSR